MNIILGPKNKSIEYKFNLYDFRDKGLTVQGMLGYYNSFGVYTSGGLDSTILLCMLLDELKTIGKLHDIEIKCFTVCKTSGSTYYADRMVKQISSIFQKELVHFTNIDNPFITEVPTLIKEVTIEKITRENPKTLFFTGVNAYPAAREKVFEYKEFSIYDNEGLKSTYKIINPFSNLLKYHILDLYYKLGYESLIPYTHSCTKDPVGSCHKCLGCEERNWAFEVLDKQDNCFIPPDVEDITFGGTYKYSCR